MTDSFGGNGCGHAGRSCSAPGCDTLNAAERSCSDCYEFHLCESCGAWFCAEHAFKIDGLMFCGYCRVCSDENCHGFGRHLCGECGAVICPIHDAMMGPVYILVYACSELRSQMHKHACKPCALVAQARILRGDPALADKFAESDRYAASLIAKLAESIEHARMGRLAKDCGIR